MNTNDEVKLKPIYKLLDWIDEEKLHWTMLSINPAAIHLLEKNQDKITLGVSSYLQDSADSSQLTMDSEGIDYEGMATVSVEFNSKVDKLTEKINGYTEIVRTQTTELKTLIFGEGQ
mgnify:CR=1 FL=1